MAKIKKNFHIVKYDEWEKSIILSGADLTKQDWVRYEHPEKDRYTQEWAERVLDGLKSTVCPRTIACRIINGKYKNINQLFNHLRLHNLESWTEKIWEVAR